MTPRWLRMPSFVHVFLFALVVGVFWGTWFGLSRSMAATMNKSMQPVKEQRRNGGTKGVDDDFAARSFESLGAWIMGRNMFGPVRGPWADDEWKGWWGANPPYDVPVFVLTHHPRPPLGLLGQGEALFDGIDLPALGYRVKEHVIRPAT